MSTVTMQELELETAELLPARETLCVYKPYCSNHGSSVSISQSNSSYNGNGNGNGSGGWGPLSGGIANGNLNGVASGNNVAIVA
jgi:hypothetical protein